jgi:hypothetical protein
MGLQSTLVCLRELGIVVNGATEDPAVAHILLHPPLASSATAKQLKEHAAANVSTYSLQSALRLLTCQQYSTV